MAVRLQVLDQGRNGLETTVIGSDGNAHDSKQLPVLLAGGGGGSLRGGRLLDYSKDPNRRLCRLHLALMERMGMRLDRFGDADSALSDLS